MRFVPKIDVRTQVVTALVLAIVSTWVVSAGVEHFLTYLQLMSYRAQMVEHPELYTRPLAEPMFGLAEFFMGYPARLPAPDKSLPGESTLTATVPALDTATRDGPQPLSAEQIAVQSKNLALSAVMALVIALLFGIWASLLFTRPLAKLMKAAHSMTEGNFRPDLQIQGAGEFAELGRTLTFLGDRVSKQIGDLERETQTRRQFLADVAHEFRTPLSTLRTMTGALQDGLADDPVRRSRALRSIVATSERLLRLVTDMLELARLDLHELPLTLQTVDARELAVSCRAAYAEPALKAGIDLRPVPGGPPVLVLADPDRLAQVFENLLSNAISHAGTGAKVSVTLEVGSVVTLGVADTGRGIAAEHLPFLGEAFYRADLARNPEDHHSGLGLRIVRVLVKAHGGELILQSEVGRGTVIEFTLRRPTLEPDATEL
ncbi:MAG: HAMP domain-containing sensor histidine kinase [Spirochaetales bacterium]